MASNGNPTDSGVTTVIRWIARIWGGLVCLLALIVFSGYALSWLTTGQADPYAATDYAPIENVPPLLMFLAALGAGIAWRWEALGGAITVVCQAACLPVLLVHWPIMEGLPRYLIAPYGLWMIIVIPGVLFLVAWGRSRGPSVSATDA